MKLTDINNRYIIHCETKEESDKFLDMIEEETKFIWESGKKPKEGKHRFSNYGNSTCYSIEKGRLTYDIVESLNYLITKGADSMQGFEIITFKELLEMLKSKKKKKTSFKLWEAIKYIHGHEEAQFIDEYDRTLLMRDNKVTILSDKGKDLGLWLAYDKWILRDSDTLSFKEMLVEAKPKDLIQMRYEEHNTIYMNMTNLMHYIGTEFDENEFQDLIINARFKLM